MAKSSSRPFLLLWGMFLVTDVFPAIIHLLCWKVVAVAVTKSEACGIYCADTSTKAKEFKVKWKLSGLWTPKSCDSSSLLSGFSHVMEARITTTNLPYFGQQNVLVSLTAGYASRPATWSARLLLFSRLVCSRKWNVCASWLSVDQRKETPLRSIGRRKNKTEKGTLVGKIDSKCVQRLTWRRRGKKASFWAPTPTQLPHWIILE